MVDFEYEILRFRNIRNSNETIRYSNKVTFQIHEFLKRIDIW